MDKKEFNNRPTYQLVMLGNRLNATNSKHYLKRFGIGVMEARILTSIWEAGEIAASDICANIGMDQAAASRTIKSLIQRGYAVTCNNGTDKRRRTLQLTEKGSQLAENIIKEVLRRTELAMTGFSSGERQLLQEFIARLMQNINLLEEDTSTESNQ